jgi:hypothetical protein
MTSELTRYRVLRGHDGDRSYVEGETREAQSADVAHLVPRVLEPLGPASKSEAPPLNKAEDAAPANKASGRKAPPRADPLRRSPYSRRA